MDIWEQIDARGPRFAVVGSIRPGEKRLEYWYTAEQAEKARESFTETWGYYQVRVYPPIGAINLDALGQERIDAKRVFDEKTSILRAAVLRSLEGFTDENGTEIPPRSEAEVARVAGVDRMTVRAWAGKLQAGQVAADR